MQPASRAYTLIVRDRWKRDPLPPPTRTTGEFSTVFGPERKRPQDLSSLRPPRDARKHLVLADDLRYPEGSALNN
jgi:hypothetical protein